MKPNHHVVIVALLLSFALTILLRMAYVESMVSVIFVAVVTPLLVYRMGLTVERRRLLPTVPRPPTPYSDFVRRQWGVNDAWPLTQPEASMLAAAVGLSGEAGEVLDVLKKRVFHKHEYTDEMREKLIKELGDVRFYYEMLCIELDVTDEYVQSVNQQKLEARYKSGRFTPEESRNRSES